MTDTMNNLKDYTYADEDEYDEETIRDRQILKECFKLEDFLTFHQTRDILENEFRWNYEKNANLYWRRFGKNRLIYVEIVILHYLTMKLIIHIWGHF